jgi:hypothetical protein
VDAVQLPDVRIVAVRQAATWTSLLVAAQAIDVVTTAVDGVRGTVESMAVSAQLLDHGGLALLLGSKLLLAAGAAAALGLAALRIRQGVTPSRITFRFALTAVQAATIGLVWVSLNNVALLSSL